jgi:hypothetical protein
MRPHLYMHHATCAWATVLALVTLIMVDSTGAQPVDIPAIWGG